MKKSFKNTGNSIIDELLGETPKPSIVPEQQPITTMPPTQQAYEQMDKTSVALNHNNKVKIQIYALKSNRKDYEVINEAIAEYIANHNL